MKPISRRKFGRWVLQGGILVPVTGLAARRRWVPQISSGVAAPTPEILWWKFSEGSGTSVAGDGTNGGDDATTSNSWSSSTPGATSPFCVTGTGTTNTASNSTIVYGVDVITVSLWIYFNDITSVSRPLDATGGVGANAQSLVLYNASGVFWLGFQGTAGNYTQNTISTPATGAWHHYAAVLDHSFTNGSVAVYVDGSLASSSSASSSAGAASNFSTQILKAFGNFVSIDMLNGRIDDVRIYDHALSAPEIASVYADPQ